MQHFARRALVMPLLLALAQLAACESSGDARSSTTSPPSPSARPPNSDADTIADRSGWWVHADPVGDVMSVRGEQEDSQARLSPRLRASDIHVVRFWHGRTHLRVRLRLVQLSLQSAHASSRVEVAVTTDEGVGRVATLYFFGDMSSRHGFTRSGPMGHEASCTFSHKIRDERNLDLVAINIPRACLRGRILARSDLFQDPDWVRVRAFASVWLPDKAETFAWDVALKPVAENPLDGWSPRLYTPQ